MKLRLLTHVEVQALPLLECPRCGRILPIRANFCGKCAMLLNPDRYHYCLANGYGAPWPPPQTTPNE